MCDYRVKFEDYEGRKFDTGVISRGDFENDILSIRDNFYNVKVFTVDKNGVEEIE